MRVLVCGGRDFGNIDDMVREDFDLKLQEWEFGLTYLSKLLTPSDTTIISGNASGADELGEDWYMTTDAAALLTFPADWKKHGKAAGFIRNTQMLVEGKPDLVIAFPGGAGTYMMVDIARKAGVEVIEVEYNA